MKKIFSLVLLTAFTLAMTCSQAFALDNTAATDNTAAYTFDISIRDEQGNPIEAANISLYSYLDAKVTKNASTEESGSCTMYYMPSFDSEYLDGVSSSNGSGDTIVYGDYIVSVSKDGYKPEQYFLTKGYTLPGDQSFDEINGQKISITLKVEAQTNALSNESSYDTSPKALYQKAVYDYLVEAGKISDENSIYVLQAEDEAKLAKQGIINPERAVVANYRNIDIPIATLHVGPNAQLDVNFSRDNTVTVQTAVDGFISGGASRSLGVSVNYAPFTSSSYQKQTYYTRGHFVKEESYHVGGYIREVTRLDQIIGGAFNGGRSSCGLCGKYYLNLSNADGSIVPIQGFADQQAYKSASINAGANASVGSFSLGVTHSMTSSLQVKYSAISSKMIYLYDRDFSGKLWHVTTS